MVRPPEVRPAMTAIVTGASAGIGAVYARKLAQRGYNLITVARNADRLEAHGSQTRQQTGRKVEIIAADLSDPAEVQDLADRISGDPAVTLVVNNAGISLQGGVLNSSPQAAGALIAL